MERRYVALAAWRPIRSESRADAGKLPRIVGTASVYYDGTDATEFILWDDRGDRCVERILPGAFDRALKQKDDVRALFNHDPNQLLGRVASGTLLLTSNSGGLDYTIDPPDTQLARDLAAWIARGDITGSSFTFSIDEQSFSYQKRDGGVLYVREVKAVRLFDVGPVTFPAYAGASVGVRAAGDISEARAAFDAWRHGQDKTISARLASIRARAAEVVATSGL
jgi:uncharacterized protein